MEDQLSLQNTIYKCYAGSMIYGTSHADSDIDIRGVCIMPPEYYYGLKRFEQYENQHFKIQKDKVADLVIYDFKKFVQLAMGANPNIIELLFCGKQHIIESNYFGDKLRDNRNLFLSKKIYHTTKGYAYAQWKKLTTKNYEGKRLELVAKYGYDVKYAVHLIRLLYQGIEILTEGTLTLPYTYNKELLDIRLGKWKYEDVLAKYEYLNNLADTAYQKEVIPNRPDEEAINKFLIKMLEEYWEISRVSSGIGA